MNMVTPDQTQREPAVGEIITLTRRSFLKAMGAGALTLALSSSFDVMHPLPSFAQAPGVGLPEGENYDVWSLCEMCVWRCGLQARVRDGKLFKLEGNPYHPHSLGKLCPRGQAGVETYYDPDRLKYPLIRAGDRGSGKFRRATWEEALDFTAQQMQAIKDRYGPEAMIFSTTHNLLQPVFENLLKAYGSPNYGTQRSLCFNSMIVANLMTYGVEEPGRDYNDVDYIIYTGRNLMEAISNSETQQLMSAIANGTHVVVLDPRFTKTAARAAEWLAVKPGTDLAFHLALIHELIYNDLYDKQFVANYTEGFDELKAGVKEYTPEWAAEKCEIPAETIARIAQEFAAAAPHAFAHPGWRTSNFLNSFQTERAIAILNALIGNWNQPGGFRAVAGEGAGLASLPTPPFPRVGALRLDGVPWKYPLVPLKLGVFQEIRDNALSGDPYQAHGWFIYRQNPVDSIPDRKKTLEAFAKMDFIVTTDIIPNDTAWFSDVILPEASYLERYDPLTVVDNTIYIRQPAIAPLGESKSGLWIFKQLGERLGLGDYFPYADEEDYLRQQLADLPVTLEDLKYQGYYTLPPTPEPEDLVFLTPSGKVDLSSATLEKQGFDAVPQWEEPPEPGEGQFYLLTGKVAYHTQMATQNNKYLHEMLPQNPLWINKGVAANLHIKDGDQVLVESEVGKVPFQAFTTEGIRPDCVYTTQGFGKFSKGLRLAYAEGGSDSDLHVTYTDPISGSQALSQTMVKISRIIG